MGRGEGAEEQRSRGAEEQRSRGAEEQRRLCPYHVGRPAMISLSPHTQPNRWVFSRCHPERSAFGAKSKDLRAGVFVIHLIDPSTSPCGAPLRMTSGGDTPIQERSEPSGFPFPSFGNGKGLGLGIQHPVSSIERRGGLPFPHSPFHRRPSLILVGINLRISAGFGPRRPLHLATDAADDLDLVVGDSGATEEPAEFAKDPLRALRIEKADHGEALVEVCHQGLHLHL